MESEIKTDPMMMPIAMEATRSINIGKLAAALAKAQGKFGEIRKNKTVTVIMKNNKGTYKFDYADLGAIIKAVRAALAEQGLSYTQFPANSEKAGLITRLMHESGQWMDSHPMYAPIEVEDIKNLGAVYTYLRRYSLSMALGVVSDDDLDASPADGDSVQVEGQPEPKKKVDVKKPADIGKMKNDLLKDILKLPEEQRAAYQTRVAKAKTVQDVEKIIDEVKMELF